MFKNYQSNVLFHLEGAIPSFPQPRAISDIVSSNWKSERSVNMVHSTAEENAPASGQRTPKPPPVKIWQAAEPPFRGYKPADTSGWKRSDAETAIVIDNGALHILNEAFE